MKWRRFGEDRIIGSLRQVHVVAFCRKPAISDATFHKWRAKYVGMDISDAMRLRQLEVENARLRKKAAEHALDNSILRGVLPKNF